MAEHFVYIARCASCGVGRAERTVSRERCPADIGPHKLGCQAAADAAQIPLEAAP